VVSKTLLPNGLFSAVSEAVVRRKLKRHFTTEHAHLDGKDLEWLVEANARQASYFQKELSVSDEDQVTSSEVVETVAQRMEPRTVGASLYLCVVQWWQFLETKLTKKS
jgi:macrodomain Ter protein organizer (MatP/YcbG family)